MIIRVVDRSGAAVPHMFPTIQGAIVPEVIMIIEDLFLDQLDQGALPTGTVVDELQVLVARIMSCHDNDGNMITLDLGDVDSSIIIASEARGCAVKVTVIAHDHHTDRMTSMTERLTEIKATIRSWWKDSPEGLPHVSVRFQPCNKDHWVFD